MKRIWKLTLVVLTLCQLLGCLVACKDDEQPDVPAFELTADQLSAYTIVVPYNADAATNSAAASLKSMIEKKTGAKLEIKKDPPASIDPDRGEYEILMGLANRAEAEVYYHNVRTRDTGYALVGKKLMIIGRAGSEISKSVMLFKMNILDKLDETGVLLKDGDAELLLGTYPYQTLSLNGVDIRKYKLIYPLTGGKGEQELAVCLQTWIEDQTGYVVGISDDSSEAAEYEIQIGDTSRVTDAMKNQRAADGFDDGKLYIGAGGKLLWLSGDDRVTLFRACTKLIDSVTASEKNLAIDLSASVCSALSSFSLSVMNYNVYYDLSEPARNPDDVIVSILQRSPDLFGLNEAGKRWLDKIEKGIGNEYGTVTGAALDTGSDATHNPIYYKKSKFDLVESGTKWLSDTPDRMSKYPDAKHYKGFTYAIFKDRATGTEFMYINVHLDGSNDSSAHNALKEVRKKQAEVLKSFTAGYGLLPIIIGGDFNEGPSSGVISGMSQGGRFRYCASVAAQKIVLNATNVNGDYTAVGGGVLDYIFVTSDSISVQKYEEWDNKINGKYPSDHLPVYAEISIYY